MQENERVQHNNSHDDSAQVTFADNSHSYFTQIPNIVFDLGLDPFEFTAYCVFRRTAGERGGCTKSIKTLCREIGCGESKLREIKFKLMTPFEKLGNKPLIKCIQRKSEHGDQTTSLIQIIDIWPENMGCLARKATPPSPNEPPPSPNNDKEHSTKNIYVKNNDNVQCTDVQDNVTVNVDVSAQKNSMLDKMQQAHKWMTDNGCEADLAKFIVNKYSVEDIVSASIYLQAQMAKPKFEFKKPKWAYFQSILKNRWWEKPQI